MGYIKLFEDFNSVNENIADYLEQKKPFVIYEKDALKIGKEIKAAGYTYSKGQAGVSDIMGFAKYVHLNTNDFIMIDCSDLVMMFDEYKSSKDMREALSNIVYTGKDIGIIFMYEKGDFDDAEELKQVLKNMVQNPELLK
jgi:hypothetical protein